MHTLKEKNNYTFNFKEFKKFKKKLNTFSEKKYKKRLYQVFNNKKTKEAVYKYILWFDWNTDVFQSWRKENIYDLQLNEDIIKIIYELKEHTKNILYKK